MLNYTRLLTFLAIAYGAVFLIAITFSQQRLSIQVGFGQDQSITLYMAQEADNNSENADKKEFLANLIENPQTTKIELKTAKPQGITTPLKYNPFTLLEAYPDPSPFIKYPTYDQPHFALINEDDYCDKADLYNLQHPENMFEKMNFYTDYTKSSVMKSRVISKIGTALMTHIDKSIPKKRSETRTYLMDKEITAFHITNYQFTKHHQIGKHFLCATQMFNHIQNTTDLVFKGQVLQKIQEYSSTYKDKPQCFDKTTFSPMAYRLFVKEECEEFFGIINSEQYKKAITTEPIQYILKLGLNAHRAEGVFLLDANETKTLHADYDYGRKCGKVSKSLLAQKYISNPLLLDHHNKFHMRVYLLIASANPFIVYFQDGYIRASIFPFDKHSENRATHLTNLLASDFAEARKENKTLYGMTPDEIDDYQIWTLEDLQDYLLETGKIADINWLDNYLRPTLQKSFMHLVRMTGRNFWKQSNTFELLGCDFMIDDNLGVWFIEANLSPQLDVADPEIVARMLRDLYEIQYAYYRSRMTRVLEVIRRMQDEVGDGQIEDLSKWKELYQDAVKNRLEPEYKIKETNTFKLVMDESQPGAQAYLGMLPEECVKN